MKNIKGSKIFIGLVCLLLLITVFNPQEAEANWLSDLWDYARERIVLFSPVIEERDDSAVASESDILEELRKGDEKNEITQAQVVSLYQPALDYEQAVIAAVERAEQAVVSIIVTKDLPVIERCPIDPFLGLPPEARQFFSIEGDFYGDCEQGGTRTEEVGGGTGFIVSSDGLILTNRHVVSDTDADYTVLVNDGSRHDAKVLAMDPILDLAVLKIEETGLPRVTIGNSDSVKLGQTAIAIGNALGEFRNTVSVGVISGLSRNITARGGGEIQRIEGAFQTDAAINPGNSGGPLLNLKGEVVAINVAMASGAQSIGFAIPVNMSVRVLEAARSGNNVKVPYLGVRYTLVDGELAQRENLGINYGALLVETRGGPAVVSGSPADQAGLRENDIITAINGQRITVDNSLALILQRFKVGERVNLEVFRDGRSINLTLILGEMPSSIR